MYEVPDWEEICGIDPNDAENFEPIEESLASAASRRDKNPNHQFVVCGALRGEEEKIFSFLLRIVDDEMYWLYVDPTLSDPYSKVTFFTDLKDAKKIASTAAEKYPEFKFFPKGVLLTREQREQIAASNLNYKAGRA